MKLIPYNMKEQVRINAKKEDRKRCVLGKLLLLNSLSHDAGL